MKLFYVIFFASLAISHVLLVQNDQIDFQLPENKRLLRLSDDFLEWVPHDLYLALISSTPISEIESKNATIASLFKSLSEKAQALLSRPSLGPGFIDETADFPSNLYDIGTYKSFGGAELSSKLPTSISYKDYVQELFPLISKSNLRETVTYLSTKFKTRSSTSAEGKKASQWVLSSFASLIESKLSDSDITVEYFNGKSSRQPSVIVKWKGNDDSLNEEIVVVGAHLDSTSGSFPFPFTSSPGADDDATGVAVLFELVRILTSSGFKPQRSIHFMAFAAEEMGLLGSKDVSKQYKADNVYVYTMLQVEMSGYSRKQVEKKVSIVNDTTDEFSRFMAVLGDAYLAENGNVAYRHSTCGYGCSDHYSFIGSGFRAGCIAEAGPSDRDLNPYIHSNKDVVDVLDFDYLAMFVKLALGFVVEASGMVDVK